MLLFSKFNIWDSEQDACSRSILPDKLCPEVRLSYITPGKSGDVIAHDLELRLSQIWFSSWFGCGCSVLFTNTNCVSSPSHANIANLELQQTQVLNKILSDSMPSIAMIPNSTTNGHCYIPNCLYQWHILVDCYATNLMLGRKQHWHSIKSSDCTVLTYLN